MKYSWSRWLKDWRAIADQSSPTTYIAITVNADGKDYEVLRVSMFHKEIDEDRAYVETPIREFNDRTALYSRWTRDLGVVRVITNNRKPVFFIEPGPDVPDWIASTEGVSVAKFVGVMRGGDLGRRVGRRDRQASKNSRERLEAIHQELTLELEERQEQLSSIKNQLSRVSEKLSRVEEERDNAIKAHDAMKRTIMDLNDEQTRTGATVMAESGTTGSPLGKAQKEGYKLISSKPLPGNFEG